ncbi:hypothetical protein [Actinomycetospora straminea]|uniref:Uncharacterized protein n=1 Tax=Actinomycetospora straminea TaxID=663607 RepID=A0ABP9F4C3_9PSEU|nr:hypothetical protein [Actinomycetospora straminea]MDD7931702.1 hypothetical protein [Actinomycetospora straminea]
MPEHGEQEHVAPPIPEAVRREREQEETAERDDSLAATERRGRTTSAGAGTDPDTSLPGTERREREAAADADAEAARREEPPIPGEEYRHRG